MKAQITRKKINLPKFFLMNWVRAGTSNSLQYLIWLKSKTLKIYSVVQSVKLLFALSMHGFEPVETPLIKCVAWIICNNSIKIYYNKNMCTTNEMNCVPTIYSNQPGHMIHSKD